MYNVGWGVYHDQRGGTPRARLIHCTWDLVDPCDFHKCWKLGVTISVSGELRSRYSLIQHLHVDTYLLPTYPINSSSCVSKDGNSKLHTLSSRLLLIYYRYSKILGGQFLSCKYRLVLPCRKLREIVVRLNMCPSHTEIFSKRRKIYSWMCERLELVCSALAQRYESRALCNVVVFDVEFNQWAAMK